MGFYKKLMIENFEFVSKFILLLLIAVLFKIVPHLPNFSPELVFSVCLATQYKKLNAIFFGLSLWVVCDFVYSVSHGVNVFGSWSLGTYSGIFIIMLIASVFKVNLNNYFLVILTSASSIFFWIWTNLTVWIFSGLYSHTITGLSECYFFALPFLGYSLMAAIFWAVFLIFSRCTYLKFGLLSLSKIDEKLV